MKQVDLLVVGGGINGAGIARDAAGRGLKVLLCEKDDLGAATSSASSKLIHGGLRYLERFEFRLVSEALTEREILLRCAPHIVRPMRFVMPHVPELRPAWMIRAGLFLYDYLARRQTLPGSRGIRLRAGPYHSGLKPGLDKGFIYYDCWVDDARLVVLTVRAAASLGAEVQTRTVCVAAQRIQGRWHATLRGADGTESEVVAQGLANAAGPWAGTFLSDVLRQPAAFRLKLVKGSHIVVPCLYSGEHAFILQNDDRRVIFAYPYQQHYTLIGTTDVELHGDPGPCQASGEEITYLCRAANRYFTRQVGAHDVVWSYCGIRPLYDDGSTDPSAVTRDYVLHVDQQAGVAPALSVFGGKITTYRRLAEHALEKLAPWFPQMTGAWTAGVALPGGDLDGQDPAQFARARLRRDFPWATDELCLALALRHGADARLVLGAATGVAGLGEHFGAGLYAREMDYFIDHEWAKTAEDVLWRRTKVGLHLFPAQIEAVERYIVKRAS
jgi:glycerol-3-phosphate dehydrogenase